MYARIATFEGGNPEEMRRLTEERMSSGEMEMPAGVTGAMVLADSSGSQRKFVTFFDSREHLDAGDKQFNKMGDEIPEDIRGRRTSVEIYEVIWTQGAVPAGASA